MHCSNMVLRNNKSTICDVQEKMHKKIPCTNVVDAQPSSRKFVGVTKRSNGYRVRIWNPLIGRKERLGLFKSPEEASMAFLEKKMEIKKLTEGKKWSHQGVSKTSTGYGARIRNPVSGKYQRLGIFESAEEASMAILAKKAEFGKGIQGVVCDEKRKKVVDPRSSGKAKISKGEKNSDMMGKKMVGVNKQKNGKYNARMKHPISKKGIWLGTFNSEEEAASVYLAKKKELEKITQADEEGAEWIVCNKRVGKKSSAGHLDPSSEGSNHHVPCLDNEDSSMEIEPNNSVNGESDLGVENIPIQENVELEKGNKIRTNNQDSSILIEPNDSFDGESASRMENTIQIMKNEGSAGDELYTDSRVWPESGVEILLRTESGVPIMNSHGFLLGEWSWIDNLSLPS